MKKTSYNTLFFIVIILVFVIGFFTGDLKITFNNSGNNNKLDENKIIENLQKLENITGDFYYSPINSRDSFINSIKNTNNSIKIQTYDFTKKEIKSELKNLLDKKGVDIKLIMENKKYQQYQNTWKQIQEYFSEYPRFEIKSDEQMGTLYTHSKIALIDSGFWIQTANLTHSSFFKNREHFFYSENSDVLESLNKIFDKDWNGEHIEIDDIHPNLVICNINCRTVIENLLFNAKDSITIETQYIVDENILDILKEKSLDTKLRFIVSDTENNDYLVDYFGPGVARKYKKNYVHTKMILIDNKILLLGSMNLSSTSLDENREIGILLLNTDIISEFKKIFENDWENSKLK